MNCGTLGPIGKRFFRAVPPLILLVSLAAVCGCEKAPVPAKGGGGDRTQSAYAEAEKPEGEEPETGNPRLGTLGLFPFFGIVLTALLSALFRFGGYGEGYFRKPLHDDRISGYPPKIP